MIQKYYYNTPIYIYILICSFFIVSVQRSYAMQVTREDVVARASMLDHLAKVTSFEEAIAAQAVQIATLQELLYKKNTELATMHANNVHRDGQCWRVKRALEIIIDQDETIEDLVQKKRQAERERAKYLKIIDRLKRNWNKAQQARPNSKRSHETQTEEQHSCDQSTQTDENFDNPVSTCPLPEEKISIGFECVYCQQTFKSEYSKRRHESTNCKKRTAN